MRKCILAVILLIAVAATCICTAAFTSHFCEDLSESVSACAAEASSGSWEKAEKHIADAVTLLEKRERLLEVFIMHHDLDEIHSLVLKISAGAKLRDMQICVSEAEYLLARINLIATADRLTVSNIF